MNSRDKQSVLGTCRRAQREVEAALDTLKKAKRWGIFDAIGGGLVPSLVKRSRMGNVEAQVDRIRRTLSELDHELARADFSGFDQSFGRMAFDLYFDNIITDFRVLGEMDQAQFELENLLIRLQTLEKKIQGS